MKITGFGAAAARTLAILLSGAALSAQAQNGKEFLQWLKEYSPTGYFIITDYETRANKPGAHKEFITSAAYPVPGTSVHETCHMLNGFNSGNIGGTFAYHVGGGTTLKVTPGFKPFTSDKIGPEIPASLRNFQTDVYILGGTGAFSVAFGLYGIFEEWSAYITDLKSDVEMAPCFKAYFNTTAAWNAMAGDAHSTTMSQTEFRYFCLRYMIHAQKNYPDQYAKILASKETKEIYTRLTLYALQTAAEWEAAMTAQGRETKNGYGWADYWKFHAELQKQEYVDMEKVLMQGVVGIAMQPRAPGLRPGPHSGGLSRLYGKAVMVSAFDPRGALVGSARLRALDAGAYDGLIREWGRRFAPHTALHISDGKDAETLRLGR